MKLYHIEKEWTQGEYHCLIIFHAIGHRCGYVGVPREHKLYGEDYDNLYDNPELLRERVEVEQ